MNFVNILTDESPNSVVNVFKQIPFEVHTSKEELGHQDSVHRR